MTYRPDLHVELQEIEIFLTLCEELHFGRTARRMYLSSARVSQTIRTLEHRLGGRLFERTSRTVRLTALGEQVRDGLRPPFEEIQRVLCGAQQVAAGLTGPLRIGIFTHAAAGLLFTEIVRTFEARHPACPVVIKDANTLAATDQIRRGDLDLAVAWLPIDEPDLTVGPTVVREERALAVPVGHPLAQRGYATVEDLADYPVTEGGGIPQATFDAWAPPRTPSGRPIHRRYHVDSLHQALDAVARGMIVHPTVASLPTYYRHPAVQLVPLRGLPPINSALIWRTTGETAAIRAFADAAEQVREQADRDR